MAIRSRDFIGIAEGIKSHELSTQGMIEQLKNQISELSSRKSMLNSQISYLEAAIAAAYENTDDEGYPDYGLISALESQKGTAENELSGVEQDLDSASNELEHSQSELESVLEEKAQTLFEIQERARTTSQNIALAGGMFGAYAGVGSALQGSMQTSLSALSQAASILGGSVSESGFTGSGNSTSGSENSASIAGGMSQGDLSTSPLAAFVGSATGTGFPSAFPPASQFLLGSMEGLTPGILPNFHSGQGTINEQKPQNFASEQDANIYVLSAFAGDEDADSNFHSFDKSFTYHSALSSSGLEHILSAGSNPVVQESAIAMSAKDALTAYMMANNYGSGDFSVYSQDPEWRRLHRAASPESGLVEFLSGSVLAQQQLSEYMNKHNYGAGDFAIYSKDPEWQRLHQTAYPDSGVVGSLVGSSLAMQHLQEYMNFHNYGQGDYPTYSKDPEWQRLHRMAYPHCGKKVMFKSGGGASTTLSIALSNKLGNRASEFFNSVLSPTLESESAKPITGYNTQKPVNQILAGTDSNPEHTSGATPIHQQFADLRRIEVHSLTKENLSAIVDVAIKNLKNRYGTRETPARFDTISKKISFIDDKQIRRELGRYYSPNICGYYSPSSDKIKINMDGNATVGDILATVDHEAMHLLSKHSKVQGGVLNSNIIYNNVGMNEGITEMLSIKNMQSINPSYVSNSYKDEVEIMRRFESICGESELLDAYMKNDTSKIEADFNQALGSRKAFEKFCNDLDILHYYNYTNPRAYDAPVQRINAQIRINQKLEQYRIAKQGNGATSAQGMIPYSEPPQTRGSDTPPTIQIRFGLRPRAHNLNPESATTVSSPTRRDKRASFLDGLYGGKTLQQQADDVRGRRKSATSTPTDDNPYKEERQRQPPDREV